MFHRYGLALALIMATTPLQSCILVPFIDSVNQLGVTQADRQTLFNEDIKQFQEARYWGDAGQALGYVVPEKRALVAEQLRKSKHEERIIETKVDNVRFLDDAYKAEVDVVVRSYRVPYYVVNERTERQYWSFTHSNRWQLESFESGKESPSAGTPGGLVR